MSMKKTYTCDICRGHIMDLNLILGVNFKGLDEFTLGAYGCTDGTHICFSCARLLAKCLAGEQIKKILELEP